MQAILKAFLASILVLSLVPGCDKSSGEDLVHIPSEAFLAALIANGADQNGDGLISYPEAEASISIRIPPSGITDLTGLEAFINLDSLSITLNPLDGIDLSANTSLSFLDITYCELKELELSANSLLETLDCSRNSLTELDLSGNQVLHTLKCKNNLLTNLDLSAVNSLEIMASCGNQLSSLDISMHPQLTVIGVDNMPMLTEVCVWTLPFPPEGIIVLQGYSPNIQYTTNCSR